MKPAPKSIVAVSRWIDHARPARGNGRKNKTNRQNAKNAEEKQGEKQNGGKDSHSGGVPAAPLAARRVNLNPPFAALPF